jgi:hypothetical protein
MPKASSSMSDFVYEPCGNCYTSFQYHHSMFITTTPNIEGKKIKVSISIVIRSTPSTTPGSPEVASKGSGDDPRPLYGSVSF